MSFFRVFLVSYNKLKLFRTMHIAGTPKGDVRAPRFVGPPRELSVELVVEDEGHGIVHRVKRLVEQLVFVLLLADISDGVASPGVLV